MQLPTFLALVSVWPSYVQDSAVPTTALAQDARHDATTPPPLTTEDESKFLDPEDDYFDLSRFLEHPAGFFPIVVPITDPTLGFGAVDRPVSRSGVGTKDGLRLRP